MWLFVPSTASASSAAEAASTSESTLQPEAALGLWCTSSGKPSRRPASWPGWKKRPWHRLLSGTTCPRSTLERGVAQWIASLAAARAKTSPSPASEPGSTAPAPASSSSSAASLTSREPRSSSGRTSGEQLALFPESTKPSPPSASEVPSSPFELLTWARPTVASGSSSSGGEAKDSPSCATWPTATATDSRSSGRKDASGQTYGTKMVPGTTLTDAMRGWQPRSATDGEKGGPNQSLKGKPALSSEAAHWATPAAGLHNYAESPESFEARSARLVEQGTRPLGANLGQQAQGWRTPTARDGSGTGGADPATRLAQGHSVGLKDEVTTWPTPNANEDSYRLSGDSQQSKSLTPTSRKLMLSLQAPPTSTDGAPTSQPEARPRLNPGFVESLMGWPAGWSLPMPRGLTDCDCWATESSPNRPPPPSPSSFTTSHRSTRMSTKAQQSEAAP